MWLAFIALLLVPAEASAHTLEQDKATKHADEVAAFVAGVLATEYRLRRYDVGTCARKSDHRLVCEGRWHVSTRGRTRVAWTCRADLVVWLEDEESYEPDWDYGPVRCRRIGLARRALRV